MSEPADQLSLFGEQAQRPGEYLVPPGAAREACRSCGARIIWTQTENGRAIPLSVRTLRMIDGVRYAATHFSDCPQSREWRRHGGSVLHLSPDTPLPVAEAAYRALAKQAHPDAGGSSDQMQRLNAAIERVRKERT
jgi:hypothetical protein